MTPPEQLLYARWLDWATRAGLALLVASFAAYALGLAAPFVPFEELARAWSLPVDRYRAAVGAPAGWGWLALLRHGDYMNFAGIALLALASLACTLRVLPALLVRGERALALIGLLQAAVLALAAAGVFGGAH
ncbi:MAG TPA: hypothetical protein VFB53_01430 [Burkholderiales bacterium]|nr:hypothetical protein [Burkholderiales bacterium]